MPNQTNVRERVLNMLKQLHLPAMRQSFESLAYEANAESLSYEQYLLELLEREIESRKHNRINRLLQQSRLPLEKNLDVFDLNRLPPKVVRLVRSLLENHFVDKKENVLAFGNPGSGKTHLLCGIAQELIRKGRKVYFSSCSLLVQDLLRAKQELTLVKLIKKLARYDLLVIDDIGYVQQNREEMEVFFTLLAERYERGSVMITSNLPFSHWEKIFKDPMTTAAAIDRIVHHSVILELNISSFRMEQAKSKKKQEKK